MIPLLVSNIGRTRYADAWTLQQELWTLRHTEAIQDILLLTEHEHVYTLGKSTDDNHLLATEVELKISSTDVFHVDRGGDITYHGPGQLVGYPIIDLNNYFLDIHRYLRSLEEVIIKTLAVFGILAGREKDMTGVWVKEEKIAAIGVKVSRWVTMHGFALNVDTDLSKFDRIIPCGIFHKGVTSMQRTLGQEVPIDSVQKAIVESFADVFGCKPHWIEKDKLDASIITDTTQQQRADELSKSIVTD
ncbi:MAG: lipoyl(octanoyl) transferase LipB [Ignavibacteriales bacterium]|nr:lipoyl(octanoyl) transferase LipB [Ignavibacteriales bacterium]